VSGKLDAVKSETADILADSLVRNYLQGLNWKIRPDLLDQSTGTKKQQDGKTKGTYYAEYTFISPWSGIFKQGNKRTLVCRELSAHDYSRF
jgi:hypothetical protein